MGEKASGRRTGIANREGTGVENTGKIGKRKKKKGILEEMVSRDEIAEGPKVCKDAPGLIRGEWSPRFPGADGGTRNSSLTSSPPRPDFTAANMVALGSVDNTAWDHPLPPTDPSLSRLMPDRQLKKRPQKP